MLATLTDGRLDGLLLMPQMLELEGRRFQVGARAHKTCDTVNRTGGRSMDAAVHLRSVRCDGAAYDGCGAACMIFWKTAWLKPVDGPADPSVTPVRINSGSAQHAAEAEVVAATRAPGSLDEDPTYQCQATNLPEATTPLPWWDLRQYVEDYTSGNVPLGELIGGAAYVLFFTLYRALRRLHLQPQFVRLYDRVQRMRGGIPFPRRTGRVPDGVRTPSADLDLKPGDRVRVKPLDRILETLNASNKNRGLFFDAEEVPYCGTVHTVRSRVDHIVDERTGKMIPVNGNTVILEDTICLGHYSDRRMFCPRAIYPFWRETWLERDAMVGRSAELSVSAESIGGLCRARRDRAAIGSCAAGSSGRPTSRLGQTRGHVRLVELLDALRAASTSGV